MVKCKFGKVKTGVREGQCRKRKMTPAHRLAIDKSKTATTRSKKGGRRSDNRIELPGTRRVKVKCKYGKLKSPVGRRVCKKKPK